MVGRDRFVRAMSGMLALLLGACSGGGSEPTPSASSTPTATSYVVAPTAEQLAAALITPDDYAGTWSVNVPSSAEYAIDGVVSDEQQAMLPKITFCDKADEKARSAAAGLRWRGFRQIDQSEADPIDPARGDRVGHMIFDQEFLTAGDPADIESMFNALRDGMRPAKGRFRRARTRSSSPPLRSSRPPASAASCRRTWHRCRRRNRSSLVTLSVR